MSPEVVKVSYPGIPPFEAEPVKIGEFCSKTPALPVSMQEQETEASRFLSALEKKHAQSRQQVADAISFGQGTRRLPTFMNRLLWQTPWGGLLMRRTASSLR